MSNECDQKMECVVCGNLNIRFREKQIYVLDDIYKSGSTIRFYPAGSDMLHSLIWGNTGYHCYADQKLPVKARSVITARLAESYMDSKGIPYSPAADAKHPWCLAADGFYEPKMIQPRGLELQLVFGVDGVETPPVVTVPAEPQYLASGIPSLHFGIVERPLLNERALQELVLPKYPGVALDMLATVSPCLLDVKLSFTLDVDGRHQEVRSWFDGNYFHPQKSEPILGGNVELPMHKDYLAYIDQILTLKNHALK